MSEQDKARQESEEGKKWKKENGLLIMKLEKLDREKKEWAKQERERLKTEMIERGEIIFKLELERLKRKDRGKEEEKRGERHYIRQLKKLIENKKYTIRQEDFYEWEIEGWEGLPDKMCSPIFIAINHKWKILFYPNKRDEETKENYVSVGIEILDISKEMESENIHIATDFVFSIRNSNDYFRFVADGYGINEIGKQPIYFSINKTSRGIERFTKKEDLFKKDESYNKSIIENNKAILDTYICSYEFNKARYIEELRSLMICDEHEKDGAEEMYYEQNINILKINSQRSINFTINNYHWRVCFYPNGKNREYISLKIETIDFITKGENEKEEKENDSISACFTFVFRNINGYSCFWAKGTPFIKFDDDTEEYEIPEFIRKDNLFNEFRRNTMNRLINDKDRAIFGVLSLTKQER